MSDAAIADTVAKLTPVINIKSTKECSVISRCNDMTCVHSTAA